MVLENREDTWACPIMKVIHYKAKLVSLPFIITTGYSGTLIVCSLQAEPKAQ